MFMSASKRFIETRDRLLRLRQDLAAARGEFTWPVFDEFNWASDYFDVIAHNNEKPALRAVGARGTRRSSLLRSSLGVHRRLPTGSPTSVSGMAIESSSC